MPPSQCGVAGGTSLSKFYFIYIKKNCLLREKGGGQATRRELCIVVLEWPFPYHRH